MGSHLSKTQNICRLYTNLPFIRHVMSVSHHSFTGLPELRSFVHQMLLTTFCSDPIIIRDKNNTGDLEYFIAPFRGVARIFQGGVQFAEILLTTPTFFKKPRPLFEPQRSPIRMFLYCSPQKSSLDYTY